MKKITRKERVQIEKVKAIAQIYQKNLEIKKVEVKEGRIFIPREELENETRRLVFDAQTALKEL